MPLPEKAIESGTTVTTSGKSGNALTAAPLKQMVTDMGSGLDLSAFMGAVKPKERTDQYVVLSALFVLSAQINSVTAKQVSELLPT